MPNGIVRWIDPKRSIGRVSRWGKGYPFRCEDAERDALTADARVHFDLRRQGGAPWAVNIRLRRGTRTSRRQHRFGDQAGVHTRARREQLDPATLAKRWLGEVERGNAAAAVEVYAPEARLHTASGTYAGRDRILAYLADNPVVRPNPTDVATRGQDENVVTIGWRDTARGPHRQTRLRVARGEIIEQWI